MIWINQRLRSGDSGRSPRLHRALVLTKEDFPKFYLSWSILTNSKYSADILKGGHYFVFSSSEISNSRNFAWHHGEEGDFSFSKNQLYVSCLQKELLSAITFKNVDLGSLPFLVSVKWNNQNTESLENKWILYWKFHIVPGLVHTDMQSARSRDASALLLTLEKTIARLRGGKQSHGNIHLKGPFPITGTPFITGLSDSRDNRKLCIVAMPRTREAIRMLYCFSLMVIWTFPCPSHLIQLCWSARGLVPSSHSWSNSWCQAGGGADISGPFQPDAGWVGSLAPGLHLLVQPQEQHKACAQEQAETGQDFCLMHSQAEKLLWEVEIFMRGKKPSSHLINNTSKSFL